MAGERHGMCESVSKTAGEQQGNDMGTAWERHGMCESALTHGHLSRARGVGAVGEMAKGHTPSTRVIRSMDDEPSLADVSTAGEQDIGQLHPATWLLQKYVGCKVRVYPSPWLQTGDDTQTHTHS
jgi:hypothetical protein